MCPVSEISMFFGLYICLSDTLKKNYHQCILYHWSLKINVSSFWNQHVFWIIYLFEWYLKEKLSSMCFVPLESENKCVQHIKAGCWYILPSNLFGNKTWHHPWLHAVSDDITVHTTSLGFLIWLECNLRRENSLECVLNYDDVYARLEITLYSLRLKTANEPMVSPKGAGPWLALRPWIDTGLLALDWQWAPGLTQGCWPLTGSEPLDWHRGAGPLLPVIPWIHTGVLALGY